MRAQRRVGIEAQRSDVAGSSAERREDRRLARSATWPVMLISAMPKPALANSPCAMPSTWRSRRRRSARAPHRRRRRRPATMPAAARPRTISLRCRTQAWPKLMRAWRDKSASGTGSWRGSTSWASAKPLRLPVATRVLHHPGDQLLERVARIARLFGSQRQSRSCLAGC